MFILQDNKLYIQNGKNKIVGVEIYSDKVVKIKGTETTLGEHLKLNATDVKIRYNITATTPYIFPLEKKGVIKDEPNTINEKVARKSK